MGDKDWRTVKLPTPLMEEIEDIKDKHGFSSNSDFITQGARELLRKYKKDRIDHFNFQDNVIRLTDADLPKYQDLVEVYLNTKGLVCGECKSKECVHIQACWKNSIIKERLIAKNLKPLV